MKSRIEVDVILNEIRADIRNVLARVNIMCPAVMLAASRNERVIGRIRVLKVSITTRRGFSHIGAPEGKRWAANEAGS